MRPDLQKIHSLNNLHKRMIEEISDYAIILLDLDGTILTWNKGVHEIKGYVENEIIGKNFDIFYTQEDRQAGLPIQLLEQAKKDGRSHSIGMRVRKDGSTFWGSIHITSIRDENNNVLGFTKLTRQIR